MSDAGRVERIAVLTPMTIELRAVDREMGLRRHEGRFGPVWVRAGLAGVGPAAATAAATRVLDDWSPDVVAVVGIAGGIGPAARVGDVVVPAFVVDHRSNERFEPTSTPRVRPSGGLVTTDGLVPGAELERRREQDGVVAVDMETAAVARVCTARGVPWFGVRGISDLVGEGLVDDSTMAMVRPDGRTDGWVVARTLARHPSAALRMAHLGRDTARATSVAAATVATICAGLAARGDQEAPSPSDSM